MNNLIYSDAFWGAVMYWSLGLFLAAVVAWAVRGAGRRPGIFGRRKR